MRRSRVYVLRHIFKGFATQYYVRVRTNTRFIEEKKMARQLRRHAGSYLHEQWKINISRHLIIYYVIRYFLEANHVISYENGF